MKKRNKFFSAAQTAIKASAVCLLILGLAACPGDDDDNGTPGPNDTNGGDPGPKDTTAPTFTVEPANGATSAEATINITITASESIRVLDDSAINNTNVDELVTLTEGGTIKAFVATIDGNVITINPDDNFTAGSTVVVTLARVEDQAGNPSADPALTASFTISLTLSSGGACQVQNPPGALRVDQTVEANIDDALTTFTTLEQKVKVIAFSQNSSRFNILQDVRNLGLNDSGIGVVDGPAGVISPAGVTAVSRATIFPAPLLMTASWDEELVGRVATAMAIEVKDNGHRVFLAPGVNLYRLPHNGRNFEYHGEDPFLISQISGSIIRNIQAQEVISTLKQYCCNNTEFDRNWASSTLDDRTLHEIYLPAYRSAVLESGVWSLMGAYNPYNGDPSTESAVLLRNILKGDWNFRGFVMSDWLAIRNPRALQNGTDLEMPNPTHFSLGQVQVQIARGRITEARNVDDAIRRILRALLGSGAAEYDRTSQQLSFDPAPTANFNAHNDLALEAAQSGIILLRNEGNTLPLRTTASTGIYVIGNAGLIDSTPRLGTGSANVRPAGNTFLATNTIRAQLDALRGSATVTYAPLPGGNGRITDLESDSGTLSAAQRTAIAAFDYIVIPVGYAVGAADAAGDAGFNASGVEGEAKERAYTLPAGQDNLIKLVAAHVQSLPEANRPRIVVTITAGGGARMSSEGWENVDAIVHSFYMGQSVEALAQVLFGVINPSGKLPFTIEAQRSHSSTYNTYELNAGTTPRSGFSVMDLINEAHRRSAGGDRVNPQTGSPYALEYGDGIFVGYRHFDRYQAFDTYFQTTGEAKFYTESAPTQNDILGVGADYINQAELTTFDGREPLFPFGHGLSYTTFSYGELQAVTQTIDAAACYDALRFSLSVTNSGTTDGAEVVQLYVRDMEWDAAYPRPYQELKGFDRVTVAADASATATIEIPAAAFAYYRTAIGANSGTSGEWVIDPGEFEIMVAGSSRACMTDSAFADSDRCQTMTVRVDSYDAANRQVTLTVDGQTFTLMADLN